MPVVLLPVIVEPLQFSVTFAAVTLKQVEPEIERLVVMLYVVLAVERLEHCRKFWTVSGA